MRLPAGENKPRLSSDRATTLMKANLRKVKLLFNGALEPRLRESLKALSQQGFSIPSGDLQLV